MKIAFLYPNDVHPRSPQTGCDRLANLLQPSVSFNESSVDYSELRNSGYRIFCYGHKPSLYENRLLTAGMALDIVNSRIRWIKGIIGIKCQSGFSYFQRYRSFYDCLFPTITTYKRISEPSEVCIGYYSRDIRPDTTKKFIELANRTPKEIPIIVMGTDLRLNREHEFTTDENYFFSKVTHYFYMKSDYHDDPWPHTLLQACQCGCSLIMPENERNWKDGVDDCLDVCSVEPITHKYPWEKDQPCRFAPVGEDFLKLYQYIDDCDWKWKPDSNWKNFSELYNYAVGL